MTLQLWGPHIRTLLEMILYRWNFHPLLLLSSILFSMVMAHSQDHLCWQYRPHLPLSLVVRGSSVRSSFIHLDLVSVWFFWGFSRCRLFSLCIARRFHWWFLRCSPADAGLSLFSLCISHRFHWWFLPCALADAISSDSTLMILVSLPRNHHWWWIQSYYVCCDCLVLNVLCWCFVKTVAWWCWIDCWNFFVSLLFVIARSSLIYIITK